MSQSAPSMDRKSESYALGGLILQTVLLACMTIVSFWDNSDVAVAAARFMAAGLPIWLVLFLVFKQIRRVHQESLETAELKRAQDAGETNPLFAVDDEGLLLEQSRLRWMVRWSFPIVSILLSLKFVLGYFFFWNWSTDTVFNVGGMARSSNPHVTMWFGVGCAFAAFACSRFMLGVARAPEYRLLRGGAGFMVGTTWVCLLMAFAHGAQGYIPWAEPVAAVLIRTVMLILGLEFGVNQILDFYRPRTSLILSRPAFDSRLLALLAEPGSVARSIAEAFNYQFGFEVSKTWFYVLLQRWFLPLLLASFGIVLVMTSVVVVDADELAVVERFGRPAEGEKAVLSPGLHMKWPYPISTIRRVQAARVHEFVIGEVAEGHGDGHEDAAVLWTEQHESTPELMLLVGAPPDQQLAPLEAAARPAPGAAAASTESVAVSLLMISVPVQYRIKDLRQYLYNYENPRQVLEGIAYQFLSEYASGVDIDVLMGPGRVRINEELRLLIQRRADELELGIEILFAGLHSAHPPAQDKVAEAFQSVVIAESRKVNMINEALAREREILTAVAGSVDRARTLDVAIRDHERLVQQGASSDEVAAARSRVEGLLLGDATEGIAAASGTAAKLLSEAQARASEMKRHAAAKVRVFAAELAAYTAAPDLYRIRKHLDIFRDLGAARKFLLLGDPSNVIVEYETGGEAPLDRVLTRGLEDELKRTSRR